MDYEATFRDFKDERLDEYCCYCGNYRALSKTTLDHVPSAGLLDDPKNSSLPTARVCHECNRKMSLLEAYAYCSISSWLSRSWKPDKQVIPKAGKILKSDKRLLRQCFQELNTDANGRTFWKPRFRALDAFFAHQAQGHLFLETGELSLHGHKFVDWFDIKCATQSRLDAFFQRESGIFPELGSRAFMRLFSSNDTSLPRDSHYTDTIGFIVVEPDSYRFRVVLQGGCTEVQSIIRERLAVSVSFESS